MDGFSNIKKKAMAISRHNGACKTGYHDLLRTENIGQLCAVLKRYWSDVIGMHRNEAFAALEELYLLHKVDFNRCGIYYNESTEIGMCIINCDSQYELAGSVRAWIYGKSTVHVKGKAHVVARDASHIIADKGAHVQLFDNASATAIGYCYIHASALSKVELTTHARVIR